MHRSVHSKMMSSLGDLQLKIRGKGIAWEEFEPMISSIHQSAKYLLDLKYGMDISSILAITDRTGRIVEVNDKFCEISGYSREDGALLPTQNVSFNRRVDRSGSFGSLASCGVRICFTGDIHSDCRRNRLDQ